MIALIVSLFISPAASTNSCDAEVRSFYSNQLKYENATTVDAQDDVASEIESQYDCTLN